MTMKTYDVIILPLAERDIARNTDYIFYEKKAPETARNLLPGFQGAISRLGQLPESHGLNEDDLHDMDIPQFIVGSTTFE